MSTLNAITSGAGGVALSGDTSGNLTIQSAGTNVATFTTTGRLGVGTTAPGAPLDVVGTIKSSTYSQYGSSMYYGIGNALSGSYSSTDLLIYNGANGILGFVNNNTEVMRIDSSGNLSLGGTGANGKFSIFGQNADWNLNSNVAGSAGGTKLHIRFIGDGAVAGTVTSSGTNTTYNTSSDYRLKEDVKPMVNALATVSLLKPCTYKWKANGSDGQGFIAHELQAVVPDCVTGEKDAMETYKDEDGVEQTRINPQGIDTSFLVATLTAAIQELNAKVDAQAAEIAALKGA